MDNNQINFNQLYYFHVIAQRGSLSEAAAVLHVSVSTLSEHLRSLEERLNTQLFGREGRRLSLNTVGRRVLHHTTMMFDISNQLVAELRDGAGPELRYLDVGITPTISKLHTVQLFEPLFNQKDFRVRLRESAFSDLMKALIAMDIGLILCNEPLPEKFGRGLVSQSVETVKYVFVGGARFKELKPGFPQSLENVPFFNYTLEANLRWKIDQYFHRHQLIMQRFGEADDVSIQRAAVQHNMCIALLPEDVVSDLVEQGVLFVLGADQELSSNIHAIYHELVHDQLVKQALARVFRSKTLA